MGAQRRFFAQDITNIARADWTESLPIVRRSAHQSYTVPDNLGFDASKKRNERMDVPRQCKRPSL
jgi:hypothetical protein